MVVLQPIAMSPKNKITALKIESEAFGQNEIIPDQYTCAGKDINPPLEISGVPKGTKSLTLIMHDPDAPGGDWIHWIKWNIPPSTDSILEGVEPQGVSGKGTSNNAVYIGPCPPAGTGMHRYVFTVYALNTKFSLQPEASRDELLRAMMGHILDQAELIGLYSAD